MSFLEDPDYQTCRLGGVLLPGLVTFSDIDYGPRLDKQKKRGHDGIKLKDEGAEPADFSILLEGNNSTWNEWITARPLLYAPKPGGERQPLAIDHPFPNDHGITTVYIKRIKVDYPTARRGWKVTLKVEQWFPKVKEKRTSTSVRGVDRRGNAYRISQAAISRGTALSGLEALEDAEFQPSNLDSIRANLF